jgi:preprotein translocase subunit SecE
VADATKNTNDAAHRALADAPPHREGLLKFFREVKREGIDKVTWPTWKETWLTTLMVFIMVGITMVFFFGVDWVLAFGERSLIGALG